MWSNPNFRRVMIALFLALVLLEWGSYGIRLVQYLRHPEAYSRYPFDLDRAGIASGDRITAINGRPYQGELTATQALLETRPGGSVRFQVEGKGEIAVPTFPLQRVLDAQLSLSFHLFSLVFCIGLAAAVALLRPMDRRSWILLFLLTAFPHAFRFFNIPPVSAWRWVHYLMQSPSSQLWAACMVFLGLYFPEPLKYLKRVQGLLLAWAGLTLLIGVWQCLVDYASNENISLMTVLAPYRLSLRTPNNIIAMLAVSFFFMASGMRLSDVSDPAARRKVVLLNVGAHLAFLPMFLILIRGMVLGVFPIANLPQWLVLGSLGLMALFPITLAYVVIVHRALDLRMVLRSGLKHAFAQRGVRMLQAWVTLGAIFYAFTVAEHRANTPQKLIVISSAFTFAMLLQLAAQRFMLTIDRRFFRDAYSAEQILGELSDEVRIIVDRETLLKTVCHRISESLHIPHIAMLLRQSNVYQPAFAIGYDVPPAARFEANDPVSQRLTQFKEPQTIYFDDPQSWVNRELRLHPDRDRLEALQAQVLLPIESRHELLGFLALGAKRSDEAYSKTDLRLLRSVASQTGMALENSRLTAEVATEAAHRERLFRELEIAREVQQRLFPQKRPQVEGVELAGSCRPALHVGGDYYDYITHPSGDLAIAVGDVSGKGIPAAILMAVVQTSVRGQAMAGTPDLSTFLRNVNLLVDEASIKGHFATLFYGQFNPHSKLLRYVNAGHNPPLLFRADGTMEQLRSTGLAIGWYKKAVFQEAQVQLLPGDVLFVYTDGFPEAMNAVKEEYGDERFAAIAAKARRLHPDAAIPAILHEVDAFTDGAPQHDDMTMIILKVQPHQV